MSSKLVDFSGHNEQENVRFFRILKGNSPSSSIFSVSILMESCFDLFFFIFIVRYFLLGFFSSGSFFTAMSFKTESKNRTSKWFMQKSDNRWQYCKMDAGGGEVKMGWFYGNCEVHTCLKINNNNTKSLTKSSDF